MENCCNLLNRKESRKIFRGDIFIAEIYSSTCSKSKDIRPVVVIQNDIGNRYSPNVIVATITSKKRKKLVTHIDIDLEKSSTILCEQIYTIKKEQLIKWIGKLDKEKIDLLNKSLEKSIGITWID